MCTINQWYIICWGKPEQAPLYMQRTTTKLGLEHTTPDWYGGLCTNKHDKLTHASIQVLSNTILFGFI